MTVERYFVFLYPEDIRLRELLDLAIYLLNPFEKWPAHITLAGPYSSKLTTPRRNKLESKISAIGVGEFKSANQNTIFLKVGGVGLADYWDKPDYPGVRMTPHLTLYDGDDAEIADMLRKALEEIRIYFFFHVSKIDIIKSIKGQYSRTLETVVNFKSLARTSYLDIEKVKELDTVARVELASEALKKAKYYLNI